MGLPFDKIERIEGIITDKNHKKINKYMAKIKGDIT